MSANLFEAWGALQGSLARLGDAVVEYHRTDRAHDMAEDWDARGRLRTERDTAASRYEGASLAYYEAHLKYQELTKGKGK